MNLFLKAIFQVLKCYSDWMSSMEYGNTNKCMHYDGNSVFIAAFYGKKKGPTSIVLPPAGPDHPHGRSCVQSHPAGGEWVRPALTVPVWLVRWDFQLRLSDTLIFSIFRVCGGMSVTSSHLLLCKEHSVNQSTESTLSCLCSTLFQRTVYWFRFQTLQYCLSNPFVIFYNRYILKSEHAPLTWYAMRLNKERENL